MAALNSITSPVLKQYEHTVIEPLVQDAVNMYVSPEKGKGSVVVLAKAMQDVFDQEVIANGSFTPSFINTCPLVQSRKWKYHFKPISPCVRDTQVLASTNGRRVGVSEPSMPIVKRRAGVSERSELDRYTFKVVFKEYILSDALVTYSM